MKSINLLPKPVSRELMLDVIGRQMLAFWVRALLLMALFFLLSLGTIFYLQSEISSTDKTINEQKATLSSSNTKDLENRVKALNKSISNLKTFENQHYYWSVVLIEIAKIMPNDIEVDSITLDRAANRIDIAGRAKTRDSAMLFYAAVKKSPMFKDINFPLKNLERAKDSDFAFTFYLKPEEMKKNEAAN
ncbi:MAG: PilN domain-containing protein [Acidobacteriaceae bacterium]